MHPFVSGELACGNLKSRVTTLSDLHALPSPKLASDTAVLQLIEDRWLWGRGLGASAGLGAAVALRVLDTRQEARRGGEGDGAELLTCGAVKP